MKKIILNASGRLGNQLFQYAFAKKVQKRQGGDIIINFYDIEQKNKLYPNQNWEDGLTDFQTTYKKVSLNKIELVLKYFSVFQKFLILLNFFLVRTFLRRENIKSYENLKPISKKYTQFLLSKGLYIFPIISGAYKESNEDIAFLNGKYENEKYILEVAEELKRDIIPQYPVLEQNKDFYTHIKNSQSVCITIRRGDYLTSEHVKDFFQCDESYFLKGINVIKSKVENPVFFFFSDDLEYSKEFAETYLSAGDEYYIENPNNPIWEKVRIMSACKHFIISNSTFSWWVQFLGNYDGKIVVGPSSWFPKESSNIEDSLTQEAWIKI